MGRHAWADVHADRTGLLIHAGTAFLCNAGHGAQGGSGSMEGPGEMDRPEEASSSSGAGFWQTHAARTASASDAMPSAAAAAPPGGAGGQHRSSAAVSGLGSRREAQQQPQQMLYIQMEFCPRTLRQVLDEGPLDAEDCWQARLYLYLCTPP